jgi:arsenate reductase
MICLLKKTQHDVSYANGRLDSIDEMYLRKPYSFFMKKIYYLSTCDTCRRIIRQLGGMHDFVMQDIKTEAITAAQLKGMKDMACSYEALFSRRALKYKEWNLKDQLLSENDIKQFILKEYTFLKRPVIIFGDQIFIGNDKKSIAEAEKAIKS